MRLIEKLAVTGPRRKSWAAAMAGAYIRAYGLVIAAPTQGTWRRSVRIGKEPAIFIQRIGERSTLQSPTVSKKHDRE